MSAFNPAAVLMDVSGTFMAVTASVKLPYGTPGVVFAGVDSNAVVRYPDIDSNRSFKITGSVGITNNVWITTTGSLPVTGSVALTENIVVIGTTVSGSSPGTNPPRPVLVAGMDVSGSVRVPFLSYEGALAVKEWEHATYVVHAINVLNAANKNMLAVANAAGSPYVVRLTGIKIINSTNSAITGIPARFELKRITSFAGTTAVVVQPYDTNDSVPVQITAGTGGTVAGEATDVLNSWLWSTDEWGSGTLDLEGAQLLTQNLFVWNARPGRKPYMLRGNEGLSIIFRGTGTTTAGTYNILVEFTVHRDR